LTLAVDDPCIYSTIATSQAQVGKLVFEDHSSHLFSSLLTDPTQTWPELTKLAEQGDISSQRALGQLHWYSHDAPSKKWFTMAAEQDDLDSFYGLAIIADSTEERLEWYLKAAERGHAMSQFELGRVYLDEETHDEAQAVHWFTKAAEQGHAIAQHYLGDYYLGGLLRHMNGATDIQAGLQWLIKSAEQGDVDAQTQLGDIYYEGEHNVTKDYQAAFKWFSRAAKQGNLYSKDMLKRNELDQYRT
jgi:TPR repeat protein